MVNTLPLPVSDLTPDNSIHPEGQARWHIPQTTQLGSPVSSLPISSIWPRNRAGKTGTSEAYNDVWFVGYTPYYTCAIWSGYDNNEKLPDYARKYHRNLWKKVMTRIHEGLPSKEFEKPASVEKLSVCEETGLLPRAGCPVITEYFDVGTMPTEYCDQHFYDSDDYDYNYDEDSSDQTDSTADTDNTETPDSETTDSNDNSDTTDDNNNNEDNSNSDNTDGSDDNSSGSEDDSSYQIDYY